MKTQIFALFLMLPCLAVAENEWIPLFDGKTTDGWTPRNEVISFEAKDGELHILSKTNVWIVTDLKLTDFIVEAEVMLPDNAKKVGFNSGLAFRCTGEKGKPKGYQCEIDLSKPGGVFGIGLGGWLYPSNQEEMAEYREKVEKANFKADDWNHLKVQCEGPRIRTWINGVLVTDIENSQSLDGYFGIQHHGKGGTVKFRNLRARRL